MPPPLMESTKPPPNRLVGALNLAVTSLTIMSKAISFNQPKMGPNGVIWGAAGRTQGTVAPLVSPNAPIFGERAPLGFLTWAIVVLHGDLVIWFGFGLILPCV
jgi:hypothetical protein